MMPVMAGKKAAVSTGADLTQIVAELGRALGLEVAQEFRVGRRLWGAVREIDVILIHPQTRKTLGIECKAQAVSGSAEEKIPSTIQDICAWPIAGIVVFAGEGFSKNMRNFLIASGKAVELDDLKPWLCLFFGLPLRSGEGAQVDGRIGPRRSDDAPNNDSRRKRDAG